MKDKIRPLRDIWVNELLSHIPHPPQKLYIRGTSLPRHNQYITIVGSRKCSEYSKQVIDDICKSLINQKVSIISGLAHGIDTYVHQAALKHNIHTVAIIGSGLKDPVLYPKSNLKLAHTIIESGGALISEQEPNQSSRVWMFPARNRIMVGLASLVIIIEARKKSGTLITARLATDYNRNLLVVPNSIYSPFSEGSNSLIKQGAYIYTEPKDVFELLNIEEPEQHTLFENKFNSNQKLIIEAISEDGSTIQKIIEYCSSKISVSIILQTITELETSRIIKKIDGTYVVLTK